MPVVDDRGASEVRRTAVLRAAIRVGGVLTTTLAVGLGSGPSHPAAAAGAAGAGSVVGAAGVAGVARAAGVAGMAAMARATAVAHTGGIPINVRTGASLRHALVSRLPDGRRLAVVCQVRGQLIAGHARRTALWDRLSSGRYVSDANVAWRPTRPAPRWCAAGTGGAPGTPAAGSGRTAAVSTGGIPLNLRTGPATSYPRIGAVGDGARVTVVCQASGQHIAGHVRRTAVWARLSGGRYVSDAYLSWRPARPALPRCDREPVGPPDPVAADPATFIARVAGPARASMRLHGVPASVTIAQAILESGWGRSELAYADHNYFGIKCFGDPGPVAVACRSYPTHECGATRCFATRATFRVYARLADSVRDHGRFLAVDNPRYRPAFAHRGAPDRFTVEIHKAGYATSPGYAKAIIALMRQYHLYRYDR